MPPGKISNHVALTVRGLPTADSPDGTWLVDVGLGDALYEPLPLLPGRWRQGPLRFGLVRSVVACDGWRLEHDSLSAFKGMDLWPEPAEMSQFKAQHQVFSTSPTSGFVRVLLMIRRTASGSEALRGCVLRVIGPHREVSEVELTDRRAWFDAQGSSSLSPTEIRPSVATVAPTDRQPCRSRWMVRSTSRSRSTPSG